MNTKKVSEDKINDDGSVVMPFFESDKEATKRMERDERDQLLQDRGKLEDKLQGLLSDLISVNMAKASNYDIRKINYVVESVLKFIEGLAWLKEKHQEIGSVTYKRSLGVFESVKITAKYTCPRKDEEGKKSKDRMAEATREEETIVRTLLDKSVC